MQTTRVYKVRGNLGFLTSLSQSNKKPKHLPLEVKFGSGVDGVVVGVVGLRAWPVLVVTCELLLFKHATSSPDLSAIVITLTLYHMKQEGQDGPVSLTWLPDKLAFQFRRSAK